MKKLVNILVLILMIQMSVLNLYALSKNKLKLVQKYFYEGVKFYIARDYQKAADEWQKGLFIDKRNKKIKQYFKKAQMKYEAYLTSFYDGMEYFKNKQYNKASDKFKKAFLINPRDARVMYYFKLCQVPDFYIIPKNEIFYRNSDTNQFLVYVDTKNTIPDWIKKWKVTITDMNNEVIKIIKGEGKPPEVIDWNLKDNKGNICQLDRVKYYLSLISIYNRVVYTKKDVVMIKDSRKELLVELSDVMFEFGKANLLKKGYKELEKVGELLKQYPDATFIVVGHTDNIGTCNYNLLLSWNRSKSVYKYLKSKYKIKKIILKAYGEMRPKYPNDTEENRRRNRRVEIYVIK